MILTDYNYAEVLPQLSTIQLASMAVEMPPKQWMADEIRKRIQTEPCRSDWFFNYLDECYQDWLETNSRPKKYRHCS